ncbi:MAG: methionine gamma-lyase family protein, partial [Firmicutes bacterium]|nr:methionine gamma-lyase family protein [Bacillota bacterium]
MERLLRGLGLPRDVTEAAVEALYLVRPLWEDADAVAARNTARVLAAFRRARVSEAALGASTGYGYGDPGRELLDAVYADVFGAEKALVRVQFVSGTHAVACALFGALRSGDELLSVTGPPYDTLRNTV